MREFAGLIKNCGDYITESKESHRRRNYKKSYTLKTCIQPMPQDVRNLLVATDFARHRGQFCRRNGHSEETDRKGIKTLSVVEGDHRPLSKEAGKCSVDESTDLDYASAHEDRKKVADYCPD